MHLQNTEYKGYTHKATPDEPRREIKSDDIAMHKGAVLKKTNAEVRRKPNLLKEMQMRIPATIGASY